MEKEYTITSEQGRMEYVRALLGEAHLNEDLEAGAIALDGHLLGAAVAARGSSRVPRADDMLLAGEPKLIKKYCPSHKITPELQLARNADYFRQTRGG